MAIMCQIQTQGFWLKSMSFYNWRLPFGKHLLIKVFFPIYHFTWLKHKNQFQLVKKKKKVIVNQWSLEPQCKQEAPIWGCHEEGQLSPSRSEGSQV